MTADNGSQPRPSLIFSDHAAYDFNRDTVNFSAKDAETGGFVLCSVSGEALADNARSPAAGNDLIPLYEEISTLLHEIANEKYGAGLVEEDGRIMIIYADIEGAH